LVFQALLMIVIPLVLAQYRTYAAMQQ